jgi:hypothetical protein
MGTFDIPRDKADRAEVCALLQRLCCRHLDYFEIVECTYTASGRRRGLLEVQEDAKHATLSCDGGIAHATARLLTLGQE